jgi:hypothetical protein
MEIIFLFTTVPPEQQKLFILSLLACGPIRALAYPTVMGHSSQQEVYST